MKQITDKKGFTSIIILKMMKPLIMLFLLISLNVSARTYYVASSGGSDMNMGTDINKPWASWQRAFSVAKAGDTVYIRGGIYTPSYYKSGGGILAIDPDGGIGHDGEPGKPVCYFNYPGEKPILDCTNMIPSGNFNIGIALARVDYVKFRGLTIRNIKQVNNYVECFGISATDCTNHSYENITIHNVDGNAFRYLGAWRHPGKPPYYYPEHGIFPGDSTFYINCDAFNCCDSLPRTKGGNPVPGGAADGFKTYNEAGSFILFEGCRAWNCSDDGFDPGGSCVVHINRCWSFGNGYLKGDGTGFKTGGVSVNLPGITRLVSNCISVDNVAGYFLLEYEDYYRTNARFYNNVSYRDERGYFFSLNPQHTIVLGVWKNNIAYGWKTVPFSNAYQKYTESNNTWDHVNGYPGWIPAKDVVVTDDDFISLDSKQLYLPRRPDGSLPEISFFKPAKGSDLIDSGTDVGLTFYGKAPDIGYAEYRD